MADYPLLEPLASGDLLAERAYEHLSRAILSNQIVAGTHLSVPELARQLNISRSPTREAVQRLIYEGLAQHVRHRGTVVSDITIEDFISLLEVRELLDGLAGRLAAKRATDVEIAELTEVLAEHEQVVDSGDEVANVKLDTQFHSILRRAAANRDLDAILGRTLARSHLSLYSLWRGTRNPRLAVAEHRAILEAVAVRDPDAAEAAARQHIVNLRERVQELVASAAEPAATH